MSLNILLLEDVHASATPILNAVPGAEVLRLMHAPDAQELESLLADVQVLGLRSRTALGQEIQQSDPGAWRYGDTAGADAVAGRNQRTTLPSGRIVTRSMARVESRVPARRLMRKPPTS